MGDIGKGGYVSASGHWVALNLHHLAVQPGTLITINGAIAQVLQAFPDLSRRAAVTEQAAFGVQAHQFLNGLAQVHGVVGIVHQFQVASIPANQAQVFIDHGNTLRHVVQR